MASSNSATRVLLQRERYVWEYGHWLLYRCMKTTIEITDSLFQKVQRLAQREKTTFRALAEEGLRLVLQKKMKPRSRLSPLITFRGKGISEELADWNWERIREEIYRGPGSSDR
jgi:hypothetical protein